MGGSTSDVLITFTLDEDGITTFQDFRVARW